MRVSSIRRQDISCSWKSELSRISYELNMGWIRARHGANKIRKFICLVDARVNTRRKKLDAPNPVQSTSSPIAAENINFFNRSTFRPTFDRELVTKRKKKEVRACNKNQFSVSCEDQPRSYVALKVQDIQILKLGSFCHLYFDE